eukprot:1344130-Rhodomonas_salina.2
MGSAKQSSGRSSWAEKARASASVSRSHSVHAAASVVHASHAEHILTRMLAAILLSESAADVCAASCVFHQR